jgi:hypothetical protein
MNKTFTLIVFILCSSFIQVLHGEILQEVVLTGNKSTNKNSLITHARIKIGSELTSEGLTEIRENLLRINQFVLKKLEFVRGKLFIEIEDKWTLFPVPMITQSGNYHSRGFLVYDDNFLGTLGTFAPGVSWTNSTFNYLLYYQDESLFTPQTGFKALLIKRSDFIEFSRKDQPISQYESRYYSYLIAPNYLYKNHVFKAGPIFINMKIVNHNGVEQFHDLPRGLFFRHHLNAFLIKEVMFEGYVTTFDMYLLKSQGQFKKTITRNEADIYYSLPVSNNFLNLGLHGHYINDHSYLFPKYLGGDEGYRGYDKSSLPASQNIGLLAQYQQHLFKQIFLAPFYEFNKSRLINPVLGGATISESTVGLGMRYYFKKISIPAVIFDAARNINDHSYHFHINIGVAI